MARSAVTELFWAQSKSKFGEHLATQASNNVQYEENIDRMIFKSFLVWANYSFLKYLR